jgi:hypothetical protein
MRGNEDLFHIARDRFRRIRQTLLRSQMMTAMITMVPTIPYPNI